MPVDLTPPRVALGLLTLWLFASTIVAWAWVIYRLASRQRILPEAPTKIVPWGGKAVLAVLMTFVVLQTLVPTLYLLLIGGTSFDGPRDQLIVMIWISLPFVVTGATILARLSGAKATDFGLELRRVPAELMRGVVAWPILAPMVFGLNYLVLKLLKDRVPHAVESLASQHPGAMTWAMIGFAAVVVAPITEEFLFRGVLLGWLDRLAIGRKKPDRVIVDDLPDPYRTTTDEGVWVDAREPARPETEKASPVTGLRVRLLLANLAVSFVFALLHGRVWPTPIPLFVLAMALGTLYQRTGSLIAPIALHMTFNGISTLMLYLMTVAGGLDGLKSALP